MVQAETSSPISYNYTIGYGDYSWWVLAPKKKDFVKVCGWELVRGKITKFPQPKVSKEYPAEDDLYARVIHFIFHCPETMDMDVRCWKLSRSQLLICVQH